MPSGTETQTAAEETDSTSFLIAGRIDVQQRFAKMAAKIDAHSRMAAKTNNDLAYIYFLYGILDGLNVSYSLLKYFFDMIYTNSSKTSSDEMHDWTISPLGITTAAIESITLISFAMLANYFSDNDKNKLKRYIAITWPYVRDVLKALKSTYKGTANTVKMIDILAGHNVNFLTLPLAVSLGAILIVNRLWYRKMVWDRKNMMQANMLLLAEILSTENWSEEELRCLRRRIKTQQLSTRAAALLSAGVGGLIDSLYLFMGVLTLAPLTGPIFIVLASCCMLYVMFNTLARIYDEYDFQRKLFITQAKIELALFNKQYQKQVADNLSQLRNTEDEDVVFQLCQDLFGLNKTLLKKRQQLTDLTRLSYLSAALAGAKGGLAAYTALSSILFMVSTILLMCSVAFPPLLLISIGLIGLVCVFGFIAYSLGNNYRQRQRIRQDDLSLNKVKIREELAALANAGIYNSTIKEIEFLIEDKQIKSSQRLFFMEWFEITRSFFSGLSKGSKSVDYTLNPLQEADNNGHYHDTPVMFAITAFSSFFHSIVLSLRAHARSFGRQPLDQLPQITNTDEQQFEPEHGSDKELKTVHRNRFFHARTQNLPTPTQSQLAIAL